MAAEAVTSTETRPELHYFPRDASVWRRPVEELVEAYVRVGCAMGPPLAQVALNHLTQTDVDPVIIEGDCILPSLEGEIKKLATIRGNPGITDRVRRAFVLLRDEDDVLVRIAGRRRGRTDRGDRDLMANQAKAVAAFGRRIEEEAIALGHRVINGGSPGAYDELMKLATE